MPLATEDLTFQVKLALMEDIKALNLVSDDNNTNVAQNVVNFMVEDESNVTMPVVIVTQYAEREETAEMGFEDDSYWLPFHVYIADRVAKKDKSNEATYLSWRNRIRDMVMNDQQPAHLAAQPIDMVEVEFLDIFDENLRKYQHLMCGLKVKVYAVISRDSSILPE